MPDRVVHDHGWWTYQSRVHYRLKWDVSEWQHLADVLIQISGLGKNANILDIPCGYGLLSEVFARRGFGATGVDIETRVIEAARERCAAEKIMGVRFEYADARFLAYENEFDAAFIVGGMGVMGDGETEANKQMLACATTALVPGGILVIQIKNILNQKFPRVRSFKTADGQGRNLNWYSAKTRCYYSYYVHIDSTGVVHAMDRPFQVRYFTPEETRAMVVDTGLESVHILEGCELPLREWNEDTFDCAWIVGRKPMGM